MTNTKTSLLSSVAVKNLVIAVEGATDEPAVWFDILVGDKLVVRTLEWIDEDGDVCEYTGRNALAWPHDFNCVAAALGLEESDVGDADFDALHATIIERLGEALEQLPSPPAPEGDDLRALDDAIEAMDAARDDARNAAQTEEDERLRIDYSNALMSLDDITVSGSTTSDVQSAFNALIHAALSNPYGQDFIREAKEVLEETQWLLSDVDGHTRVVERLTHPEGSGGNAVPLITAAEISAASEWRVYCYTLSRSADLAPLCGEAEKLLSGVSVKLVDIDCNSGRKDWKMDFAVEVPGFGGFVSLPVTADDKNGLVTKPLLKGAACRRVFDDYETLFDALNVPPAYEALKAAVLVGVLLACDKLLPPRLFRLWWTSEDGQGSMEMSREVPEAGVDDAIAADLDELLDVCTSEEDADDIREGNIDVAFDCYDLTSTSFDTVVKAA